MTGFEFNGQIVKILTGVENHGGKGSTMEHDKYALDELLHRYMNDEIDFYEVIDFCDELEPTEENKKMLLDAIDCFDIIYLYDTLDRTFGELLTDEEKLKYRQRFERIFDLSTILQDVTWDDVE